MTHSSSNEHIGSVPAGMTSQRNYLTAALPGTGGLIKQHPDDFSVEEIPRYLPCGEGEHLFITLEKTGLTTWELIKKLSRQLGIKERDVGYAGLKDAKAVTRQTVSVPRIDKDRLSRVSIPGVTVLQADYHRNKLRLGHLSGNRFQIRIRQPHEDALDRALDILQVLADLGVPNVFGEQRYGLLGNSHQIGQKILRGDWKGAIDEIIGAPQAIRDSSWKKAAELYQNGAFKEAAKTLPSGMADERKLLQTLDQGIDPGQAILTMPRKKLRFYLSAYQSELFDRLVSMRLPTIERLWAGDLAFLHDRGACFGVTDPAAEQPRADRLEISPTAPLFGYKVKLASGPAGILEEGLLSKEGLSLDTFRLDHGLAMEGERRPLRVPLGNHGAQSCEGDLILSFSLPPGSFATSVLFEVMKSEPHFSLSE